MKGTKKLISSILAISMIVSSDLVAFAATSNEMTENILAGTNRYETAVQVSKSGWTSAKEAVLVNGSAMADALSATPLAYRVNGPILLTTAEKLNEATKTELKRLGIEKVYIIGGTGVVSESIIKELDQIKIKSERISGMDRYSTSLEVAKRLDAAKDVEGVALVNGVTGLADAVSVASAAAQGEMPILLTKTEGDPSLEAWIKGEAVKATYLVGGKGVLSEELEKRMPNSKRLGGANRHETNANIVKEFFTADELNKVYVAKSGVNKLDEIVDALAVGPLAAKDKAPVVIVGNELNERQEALMGEKRIKEFIQVGGGIKPSVISKLEDTQEGKEESNDKIKPVITLIGSEAIEIEYGKEYKEPGFTASDDVDGDISNKVKITYKYEKDGSVISNINTKSPGKYIVEYSVSDEAGNKAITKYRYVTVKDRMREETVIGIDKNTIEEGTFDLVSVKGEKSVTIKNAVIDELNVISAANIRVTNCTINKINILHKDANIGFEDIKSNEILLEEATNNITGKMDVYLAGGDIKKVIVNSNIPTKIEFKKQTNVEDINVNTGAVIESLYINEGLKNINLKNSKPVDLKIISPTASINVFEEAIGEVLIHGNINKVNLNTNKKIKVFDGTKITQLCINKDNPQISVLNGGKEKVADKNDLALIANSISCSVKLDSNSVINQVLNITAEELKKIENEKRMNDNTAINLSEINSCNIIKVNGQEDPGLKAEKTKKILALVVDSGKFSIPEEIKNYNEEARQIYVDYFRFYLNNFSNKKQVQENIYNAFNVCLSAIEIKKFDWYSNPKMRSLTVYLDKTDETIDITDEIWKLKAGERIYPLSNSFLINANDYDNVSHKWVPSKNMKIENGRLYILPSKNMSDFRTDLVGNINNNAFVFGTSLNFNVIVEMKFK